MLGGVCSTYEVYAKLQSNDLGRRDNIQYAGVDEIILQWMIMLLLHYVPLCSVCEEGGWLSSVSTVCLIT
jgi:hypothetical protein